MIPLGASERCRRVQYAGTVQRSTWSVYHSNRDRALASNFPSGVGYNFAHWAEYSVKQMTKRIHRGTKEKQCSDLQRPRIEYWSSLLSGSLSSEPGWSPAEWGVKYSFAKPSSPCRAFSCRHHGGAEHPSRSPGPIPSIAVLVKLTS